MNYVLYHDTKLDLVNLENETRALYGDDLSGLSATSNSVIFHFNKDVNPETLKRILENHNPNRVIVKEKSIDERVSNIEREIIELKASKN